jgi:hypothetical protein
VHRHSDRIEPVHRGIDANGWRAALDRDVELAFPVGETGSMQGTGRSRGRWLVVS